MATRGLDKPAIAPVRVRLDRVIAAIDRSSWLVVLVAGALCAFVVVATIIGFAPAGRTFADWLTYVHAVQHLLAGEPIYAAQQLAGPYVLVNVTLFGYAYPPSSVPLFIPFSSYPIGLVAWLTLNAGALLTGLYAILRTELQRSVRLEFALVLLALAFLRGFPEGMAFGNASVAVAGLFAWAWVLGRGRPLVGVLAGIGATVKLVPGVMVFWSPRRDLPRVMAATAATIGILFVVTLPLVGIGAWADYIRALSLSEPACGLEPPVSLACVLQPAIGVSLAKAAGIVVAIAAGILAVLTRRQVLAFALLAVAWIAPVTDLHFHYFLVAYVVVTAAIARWLGHRSRANEDGDLESAPV